MTKLNVVIACELYNKFLSAVPFLKKKLVFYINGRMVCTTPFYFQKKTSVSNYLSAYMYGKTRRSMVKTEFCVFFAVRNIKFHSIMTLLTVLSYIENSWRISGIYSRTNIEWNCTIMLFQMFFFTLIIIENLN